MRINPKYTPSNNNDNAVMQRREFMRRKQDVCMVNVDGHPYAVLDWSQGGILFQGDGREFVEGQHVNMTLRFKIGNNVEDIKVSGQVIRKGTRNIAVTFTSDVYNTTFDELLEKLPA